MMKIWVFLIFITINGQSSTTSMHVNDNYTENLLIVGKPYFAPNETEHVQSVTVRLYSSTEGAKIKYTLDRSIPDDNSPVFLSGDHIFIDTVGNNFINAVGFKEGYENSAMASKKYVIIQRCDKPIISPDGGTFAGSINIAFSTTTSGASIYYTLDGSQPTSNNLAVKTGETINIGVGTTTIKCITKLKGYAPSSISTATFVVLPKASTPVIAPNYDIFTVSATLTITCSTPNVTIYYTTNGEDPSLTSLVLSQGNTIVIDTPGTHTIKAYATTTHSNILPSDIITKIFKIQLRSPRPLINPTPGVFVGSVKLNFICQDDNINSQFNNNKIFYTIDGKSTPTQNSPYILCSTSSNSNSNTNNNNDNYSILLEAPGTYIIRAFTVEENKSPSSIIEGKYELFRPDHDDYPIQLPSRYQDIVLTPDFQIISIEKEIPNIINNNYSQFSTLSYNTDSIRASLLFNNNNNKLPLQCTNRVVTGRLVVVRQPYGHLDFLEPLGGCGNLALPMATLEAYYRNTSSSTNQNPTTTTTTITTSTVSNYSNYDYYRQTILKGISDSELLTWYESQLHTISTSTKNNPCLIASPAGYFNTTTKRCTGNLVNSKGIIQTSNRQHINFGIRNGSYITGYLNADEILDSSHPFDTLISGKIWLVRNGKSFVLDSIAEDEDFEDSLVDHLPRFVKEVSARSAIGYDKEGQLLVLQVDGKTGSTGMSILEFAELAVELGFLSAVNLEGGDLTSLYLDSTLISVPSASCDDITTSEAVAGNVMSTFNSNDNSIITKSSYTRCVRPVSSLLCVKNMDPKVILGNAYQYLSTYPLPISSPSIATPSATRRPTTSYPTSTPHTLPTTYPVPSPTSITTTPNKAYIPTSTPTSTPITTATTNKPNNNNYYFPFPSSTPTTPTPRPTYFYFKIATPKPSYYRNYNNDDLYSHPSSQPPISNENTNTNSESSTYQSYHNMTSLAMANLQKTIDLYRFISFVLGVALFISICIHIQNCLSHRRQAITLKQGDIINGLEPSESEHSYSGSSNNKPQSWLSKMRKSWDVEEGEEEGEGNGEGNNSNGNNEETTYKSRKRHSQQRSNIQMVVPQTVITEEYIQNKRVAGGPSQHKLRMQVPAGDLPLPNLSEQHWQQRLGDIDLDKDSEEEDNGNINSKSNMRGIPVRKKPLLPKSNANSSSGRNRNSNSKSLADDDLETIELYSRFHEKDIDKIDGGSSSTTSSIKPVNNNKISSSNSNYKNSSSAIEIRNNKTKRKSKKKIGAKGYAELSDDIPEISGDEEEVDENPFYRI